MSSGWGAGAVPRTAFAGEGFPWWGSGNPEDTSRADSSTAAAAAAALPLTSAPRLVPSRVGRAIRFRSPSGVRRGRTGSGLGVFLPRAEGSIAPGVFPQLRRGRVPRPKG
jgi:hypothetical protein